MSLQAVLFQQAQAKELEIVVYGDRLQAWVLGPSLPATDSSWNPIPQTWPPRHS